MATHMRKSGGSNKATKVPENDNLVRRRQSEADVDMSDTTPGSDDESDTPCFTSDSEILSDLRTAQARSARTQHLPDPHLEIEEDRHDATAHSPRSPTTPPMATWRVDPPSMKDMEDHGSSQFDQEQKRALKRLRDDESTCAESTTQVASTGGSKSCIGKLRELGGDRWFEDTRSTPPVNNSHQPNTCSIGNCSKSFTIPSELAKHVKTHTPKGQRPYVCKECPSHQVRTDFLYPKDLLRHFIEIHGVEERSPHLEKATCDICKKEFTRKGGLARHQQKFGRECAVSNRRRRQSAPPTSQPTGHGPFESPHAAQPVPESAASYHVQRPMTASSTSSHVRMRSGSSDQQRPRSSSATDTSVQDPVDMEDPNIDPMLLSNEALMFMSFMNPSFS